MRLFILISSLLFSQTAICGDTEWLAGVYVDTLNKVNIKGGITLSNPKAKDPKPFDFGSFKYADLELGYEGSKISLGAGLYSRHGLDRIGFSYAHLKSQDLAGVESVLSSMGLNVKLGYYFGLNSTKNRILVGLGFGF
jgi:hypothetical protein